MIIVTFNYCDVIWGNCGKCLSDRLQKLQNRAARLILGLKYTHHVGVDELSALGWKTLTSRRNLHLLQSMYKAVNNELPDYINSFQRTSDCHSYPTRHSQNLSLKLPLVRLECGKRKFSYRGITAWNSLPPSVKTCTSKSTFRTNCRAWLAWPLTTQWKWQLDSIYFVNIIIVFFSFVPLFSFIICINIIITSSIYCYD